MKFHSIQLEEGSAVTNMTLASGTSFPGNPTEGELFYRSDVDPSVKGVYVYIQGLWGRIASADAITVPSGVSFPSAANPGDLFYINTNDSSKGLYVYSGEDWGLVANGGSGSTATVTGDVTGTLTTGSTGTLTLATVATAGTSGSASKTVTVTIDAKGRVTSMSDQDIEIAASQITSGTIADVRIAQSSVTQHEAALTILESQITDGTVLARVAGDETITGNWHFNNGFSSDGTITAANISGTNTGDQTITLTGDVTGSGTGSFATTISSGSISNAKLASMPAHTFKGNNTGSAAAPDDLTATELTAELDVFTSALKGLVPNSGGGSTNFLRADGTWAVPVAVSSFNTRTGAVTLTSSDVTTALGFTPLSGNQTITVSGDATGSGTTAISLTLGTVNSNVGSFGSASAVPSLTVNGKGLVTAVSNTPIAIAASQVTSGTFADARIAQSSVTQHEAALTILESQITDGLLLARNAGNETITGTWTFNNAVSGATPTAAAHLATKDYVDNLATGLDFKSSVRAATTANITLSGTQTVDGVALVAGNRVLVKDQTDSTTNGIYVVAPGAWTRASDADNTPSNEVSSGMYCFVESGTVNADTGWVLTTDGGNVTLGTTALVFTQFTGLGQITAGTGLSKAGSTLSIANIGTAGTYTAVTTNAQGQVTSGANLTATGDATGTASGSSIALTLSSVGTPVTSSFVKITTDAKGRVSGTTAVTTADITGLVDATYVNVAGDTMTGNLGIGVAPNVPLTIYNATSQIQFVNSATGSTINDGLRIGMGGSSSTDAYINLLESANLIFNTNATERMRIDSAGNVGIGMSPGSYKLNVLGDCAASGGYYTTSADGYLWASHASGILRFGTANAERVRIDASGSLLIGATSAISGEKLRVESTSAGGVPSAVRISNAGTTVGTGAQVQFNTNTNATAAVTLASIQGVATDIAGGGALVLNTSNAGSQAERMRINASGNVGIGTNNPTHPLHIERNQNAQTRIQLTNTTAGTAATSQLVLSSDAATFGIEVMSSGYTTSGLRLPNYVLVQSGGSADALVLNASKSTAPIILATGGSAAANERMRIDSAGNVLMGLTATTGSYRLEVAGNVRANAYYANTTGDAPFWNTLAGNLLFGTNNAERMRIDSAGNVGVGTTPGSKFDVAGVARATGFGMNAVGGSVSTGMSAPASDTLGFYTNTIERARIDSTGSLLVGASAKTSSERVLISYSSAGASPRTLQLHNPNTTADTGSAIMFSTLTNSGALMDAAYIVGFGVNGTGGGGLAFATAASGTAVERMRINNAGTVAINQASPAANAKLDINGTVALNITAIAAVNMDLSSGTYFTKTVSSATAFTVSNIPASRYVSWLLKLTNGGSATVTWPTGTKWNGGVAPTLTTAGIDVISFFTDDGGATIHAFLVSKDSK